MNATEVTGWLSKWEKADGSLGGVNRPLRNVGAVGFYYSTGGSATWLAAGSTQASGSRVALGSVGAITSSSGPLPITWAYTPVTFTFGLTPSQLTESGTLDAGVLSGDCAYDSYVNTYQSFILPPLEVSYSAESGWVITDSLNPDEPAPLTLLDKFFGKDLTVPFYVEGNAATVDVVIGGQTYTFPVEHADGDSGGVVMLSIPIPQGWDGSATINGQSVALAPRLAYSGTPGMELYANPYNEDLPPGMTRGVPSLPAGMTASDYYGLPAGMTAGTNLPLPNGVTAVTSGGKVGDALPVGVTQADGGRIWTTGTPAGVSKPGTVTTTATGVKEGESPVPGGSDAEDAALSAGLGAYGDETTPGVGLEGLAAKWETLKAEVQGRIGTFSPLASGSMPRASVLDAHIDFGRLGARNLNLDLTGEPFSTARALALVFVTFYAGLWFINFLKV